MTQPNLPPQTPAPYAYYSADDEINLADLARKIWATRKIWLASMLLVTAGFVVFWGSQHYTDPVRYSHGKPVQFVFTGIEKGEYPNGSRFQIADLIAPSVLHDVYEDNKISEYGLGEEGFQRAFTVTPYAVDEAFIVAKYASALDNKKASTQDLENAQTALKQELQQARNRAALIRFTPEQDLLPRPVIAKALDDVAIVWARKAVEERGVLQLDINLHTHHLFDAAQLAELDYPVAILLLRERLQLIQSNIKNILSLPNAQGARDQETKYSLNDMQQKLEELETYELGPLEAQIQQQFVSRDLETTLLYLHERITKLQDSRNEQENKARAIRSAMNHYGAGGQGQNEVSANPINGASIVPQIGDKFMDRLVSLVQESSDLQYRQKLNNQAIEIELQVIEADNAILRLQRQLANFTSDKAAAAAAKNVPRIEDQMFSIFTRLREHALIAERIYARLSAENLGISGRLFQPLAEEPIVSGSRLFIARQFKLAYVLALVLISMLVIPGTMLRNSLREKNA